MVRNPDSSFKTKCTTKSLWWHSKRERGAQDMWRFALLFCVVFATTTSKSLNDANDSDSGELREQLSVLSKQVTALLDRRRDDLELIEENLRKKLYESEEIQDIKNVIQTLRQDMKLIRSNSPNFPTTQNSLDNEEINDRLTIKWLQSTVNELRTELKEVQETVNSTVILQNHEQVDTELNLLKSDVLSLNRQLETAKNSNEKYAAKLEILGEEIASLRQFNKANAISCGKLKHQMRAVQLEMAQTGKILQETQRKPNEIPEDENDKNNHHPYRHQRILKKHVMELEKSSKQLAKENQKMRMELLRMKEEMKILQQANSDAGGMSKNSNLYDRINGNEIENLIRTNRVFPEKELLENLTAQQAKNSENIANLTKQMSDFDRLHLSILELLENVENIEFKVDNTIPDIRKEISKIEVQGNQIRSDLNQFEEEISNSRNTIKAIGVSVSNLQDKSAEDHRFLVEVDSRVQNLIRSNSLQNSKLHDHILKSESAEIDLNGTKSAIHLVQELKSFESEYKNIINKLPSDCGSVNGPNGIYLISPGDEGEPILASCENGWTTVQKRFDGSLNFNQNWNNYSNGFGSATGEHWIGNRNLHRLTEKNCSTLQINMKDIYGKYWQANYDQFTVLDYNEGFKLTVGKYHGNASDALDYQNNMEFSTIDNDRDISNTHCASNYEGGWWFSHCQHANLNGRYNLGLTWFDSSRNEWIAISTSEMRVKSRENC